MKDFFLKNNHWLDEVLLAIGAALAGVWVWRLVDQPISDLVRLVAQWMQKV